MEGGIVASLPESGGIHLVNAPFERLSIKSNFTTAFMSGRAGGIALWGCDLAQSDIQASIRVKVQEKDCVLPKAEGRRLGGSDCFSGEVVVRSQIDDSVLDRHGPLQNIGICYLLFRKAVNNVTPRSTSIFSFLRCRSTLCRLAILGQKSAGERPAIC